MRKWDARRATMAENDQLLAILSQKFLRILCSCVMGSYSWDYCNLGFLPDTLRLAFRLRTALVVFIVTSTGRKSKEAPQVEDLNLSTKYIMKPQVDCGLWWCFMTSIRVFCIRVSPSGPWLSHDVWRQRMPKLDLELLSIFWTIWKCLVTYGGMCIAAVGKSRMVMAVEEEAVPLVVFQSVNLRQ
jgi:hypothetical protein